MILLKTDTNGLTIHSQKNLITKREWFKKGEQEMSRKRRGRGEGSISQRSDGLWEAKISLGLRAKRNIARATVQAVEGAKARSANVPTGCRRRRSPWATPAKTGVAGKQLTERPRGRFKKSCARSKPNWPEARTWQRGESRWSNPRYDARIIDRSDQGIPAV